jgi:ATP-binding cassette subfamily B multidrug efflux pump
MKLIFRYVKPFSLSLMVCIAFLFVQVLTELGLPRLMSSLVDTGIQTGGIEPEAPDAISSEGLSLLKIFLSEQDAAALEDGYKLVASGSGEARQIAEQFPLAKSTDVYELKVKDGSQAEAVEDAYMRAVGGLALSLQGVPGQDGSATIQLERLYEMTSLFMERKASGRLDSSIAEAMIESPDGLQLKVIFTRLFYEELGVNLERLQHDYIFETGMKMLGVALLGGLVAIVVGWYASWIGTSVAMRIRRDVFKKVGQFSNEEYDNFSTASLITRTTNDVQQIQQFIMMALRLMLFAPIMGIGGIILAIQSSTSLSWIIAVAVISIVGLMVSIFVLAAPKFKILQGLIDKLNLVSRENLSGMMVIRALRNEPYEESRFEQANASLRITNRHIQRTMSFLFPAMMLVMNLVTLLIIWVGASAIEASELEIGNMMAFMQYVMLIIMSFLFMAMMFVMIPRALVSARRIEEVLHTPLSIQDPAMPKTLPRGEGITIEFDLVSFRYRNAEDPVLEEISFTAKPGETTAFIGTTGAGKSTLVNLVPRFYDVTGGNIRFNGVDIREFSQKELRENIGYVPQKGGLFSGDIASNVAYGKETAGEEEIREALRVSQGLDFVDRLADGTASTVAQGGTNFSGGQRQRLSIARALLKKSPIYIFDDSFSALDLKTDAALRRALMQFTSNATVLLVAQRISSIKNADQIVVLDKGRVVDKGTHQELMERCETYREIAKSQLTKEELA